MDVTYLKNGITNGNCFLLPRFYATMMALNEITTVSLKRLSRWLLVNVTPNMKV